MSNSNGHDTLINLNKTLRSTKTLKSTETSNTDSNSYISNDMERRSKEEKTSTTNESSSEATLISNETNDQKAHVYFKSFKDETVSKLFDRFRKFMPVVVDVETAGFNASTDALLEIACIPILLDEQGIFYPGEALNAHIQPFEGANLEKRALEFTGIDPNNPMRKAIAEEEKPALRRIFKSLKTIRKEHECQKCILVGHNAHFDLSFLNAAIERTNSKNHNPFHQFSIFDTVTLSALAYGQTVLARACKEAGIDFSGSQAHSALYDTQKTAELFCHILNSYPMLQSAIKEDNHTNASDSIKETDSLKQSASDTKS